MKLLIYRYNPETDAPRMQEHVLAEIRLDMMLRDALIEIKASNWGQISASGAVHTQGAVY